MTSYEISERPPSERERDDRWSSALTLVIAPPPVRDVTDGVEYAYGEHRLWTAKQGPQR